MWATVIAAAVISFTLPSMNAAPEVCTDTGDTLRDLDSVFVYGFQFDVGDTARLRAASVRGMEGMMYACTLPHGRWEVWVLTSDTSGNRSCPSPTFDADATAVDVPRMPPPPKRELFDIAGRRVHAPVPPGIYIERTGRAVGRVVIVR